MSSDPRSVQPSTIRVMAADDHLLLREGISAVLEGQPDMALVGEATNGREAIETYRRCQPDVVLMDLMMPEMGGIEATAAICREFPNARVVVLTTYKGDMQVLRALKAGAYGYLLKSMLRKELLETIRAVHAGKHYIPPEIASEIAEHVSNDRLTEREMEVLRHVALGNSNKEVAAQLSIAEETVKAHMKNILLKLSAKDRTHAVTIAIRRGILEY